MDARYLPSSRYRHPTSLEPPNSVLQHVHVDALLMPDCLHCVVQFYFGLTFISTRSIVPYSRQLPVGRRVCTYHTIQRPTKHHVPYLCIRIHTPMTGDLGGKGGCMYGYGVDEEAVTMDRYCCRIPPHPGEYARTSHMGATARVMDHTSAPPLILAWRQIARAPVSPPWIVRYSNHSKCHHPRHIIFSTRISHCLALMRSSSESPALCVGAGFSPGSEWRTYHDSVRLLGRVRCDWFSSFLGFTVIRRIGTIFAQSIDSAMLIPSESFSTLPYIQVGLGFRTGFVSGRRNLNEHWTAYPVLHTESIAG